LTYQVYINDRNLSTLLFKWGEGAVVCFVDMGGIIVDHHCLNFLFTIQTVHMLSLLIHV